jgi:acyl carrier protein
MNKVTINDVMAMINSSGADINDDISDISASTSFESIGLDSLDMYSLLSEIDDTYNVVIPDDEAEKLLTIGDIIKYIENI